MKAISLFSGIGGIDLGLELAGIDTIAQVEFDLYCREVLAQHWPDVPRFVDVKDVNASNLPSGADIISGGFPCQDISYAGVGKGIHIGTRSGLWYEFARLIDEIHPAYVIVENVRALQNRGLEIVLSDLAAMRYDAEWTCLSAAAFGAPHLRERLFIVAYARQIGWDKWNILPNHGTGRPEFTVGGQVLAHSEASPNEQPRGVFQQLSEVDRHLITGNRWNVEPSVGRVAHGVPRRVQRLSALGNAVVPQVAEYVGRCVVAHARSRGII